MLCSGHRNESSYDAMHLVCEHLLVSSSSHLSQLKTSMQCLHSQTKQDGLTSVLHHAVGSVYAPSTLHVDFSIIGSLKKT